MSERPHLCRSSEPLPEPGQSVECAACGLRQTRAGMLNCRRRGPLNRRSRPLPVDARGLCVHLGTHWVDVQCTCGSKQTVPVYRCTLLRRACMPADREKLADPDVQPLDCQKCDKWQVASGKWQVASTK